MNRLSSLTPPGAIINGNFYVEANWGGWARQSGILTIIGPKNYLRHEIRARESFKLSVDADGRIVHESAVNGQHPDIATEKTPPADSFWVFFPFEPKKKS